MSVRLHIQSISLEGLPLSRRDRRILAETVELELARRLGGDRDWPRRDLYVGRVESAHTRLPAGTEPRALGAQLAASVESGLGTAVGR